MSHEISIKANGAAEMAYIGATPWHGLGQKLVEGAPIEEWIRAAGFDWQGLISPVQYLTADGQRRTFPDRNVIYRSDTGAALGVGSDMFKVHQPAEILESFRDLVTEAGFVLHTAGVLKGGRRLWAMARRPGNVCLEVVPGSGDKVKENLLIATALDGSMATEAIVTAIRVVCANTFRVARGEGSVKARISHKQAYDSERIYAGIGFKKGGRSFASFMDAARRMAETPMTVKQAEDTLRQLFKSTADKAADKAATLTATADPQLARFIADSISGAKAESKDHRNVAKVLALFTGDGKGSALATAANTRWGLFNAVTEFTDWHSGRSQDTRLSSAWFGAGADLKEEAFALLTV